MRKAGRYTAALLLIAVGAAVIADQYAGTHMTGLLIDWWPVLFISLGLEYILFNMKYGESDKQLRLDLGGVICAVLISAVVVGSTNTSTSFHNWLGGFDFGKSFGTNQAYGEGRKFQKETIHIPITSGLDRISMINESNGNVTIKSGSTNQVDIETIVYVSIDDEGQAAEVANQSGVEQKSDGHTLKITAQGREYGGNFWSKNRPLINMVITVPTQLQANMDIDLTNGRITADQLTLKKQFKVRNTNGEILLTAIEADIDMESTNARVVTTNTKGRLKLATTNGTIEVGTHQGDAELESTNGELIIKGVTGSVQAQTTNGNVTVTEAARDLKAHTVNGMINATSHAVNGAWDIETNHGEINLGLPSTGDYRVKGEGKNGRIQSSIPLQIRKDTIDGSVGSGKNKIQLDTKGTISIRTVD
jgi:DUF4097 and DUF4098 domain-containing protein YvlB